MFCVGLSHFRFYFVILFPSSNYIFSNILELKCILRFKFYLCLLGLHCLIWQYLCLMLIPAWMPKLLWIFTDSEILDLLSLYRHLLRKTGWHLDIHFRKEQECQQYLVVAALLLSYQDSLLQGVYHHLLCGSHQDHLHLKLQVHLMHRIQITVLPFFCRCVPWY